MTYPIEVISIGRDDLYDDILVAIEELNAVQREFLYFIPPDRFRRDGWIHPRDDHGYHSDDLYAYIKDYRSRVMGYRPFIIGVVNDDLRSAKKGNLFGTHEAEKYGAAIVTLVQQEQFTSSRLQFLCYYLIRYSLTFIAPSIKAHPPHDDGDCFFDSRDYKLDLLKSMRSGRTCDACSKVLLNRLSPEVWDALQSMIAFMKQPTAPPRADIGIITIVTEETKAVTNVLQANAAFSEGSGRLSSRFYYQGSLPSRSGESHSIACVQALRQGNQPFANAYNHLTEEFSPSLVVLLGISGGVHKDIDLCDVHFAEDIYYYDRRKITSEGTRHRALAYQPTPQLLVELNRFFVQHGEPASFESAPGSIRPQYKLLRGPIGCGEAVIAYRESEERTWLQKTNDKILSVETEAAGLAQVFTEEQLHRGHRADAYFVVRGISDHADKDKGDQWRQPAADNAMNALSRFLAAVPKGGWKIER